MTLFEIDDAIRNFEFEVDEETGEITNCDALDELHMAREQKIENIGLLIKNYSAEADAIKSEIEHMTLRMKRLQRKRESLLDYMKYALQGEPFSTPRMEAVWRTSKSVEIIDSNIVPDELCRISVKREPDKTLIKKAIKDGKEVAGARIVENRNLNIK